MKAKRIASIVSMAMLLMGGAAYAQIPDNSILLGDKGYAVELLFDDEYTAQIQESANDASGYLYYNLGAGWKDIFTGEDIADFDSWPQVEYTDAEGTVKWYDSKNGNPIAGGLTFEVGSEIMWDGQDYYLPVTFNVDLAGPDTTLLEDLDPETEGYQHLSVDGDTSIADIFVPEWSAEKPEEIRIMLKHPEAIPVGSEISFTFKSGELVGVDESTILDGNLQAVQTITYNEALEE